MRTQLGFRALIGLLLVLALPAPGCGKPAGPAAAPPGTAAETSAEQGDGETPAAEAPVVADGHAATFVRYAVAADHPQASAAGAAVLAAGGTAADAAAAVLLALGVVSPASSGLGGGGFALYYDADTEEVTYLDFREWAPAAARPDMFEAPGGGPGGDEAGAPEPAPGLSAGVPGEPLGIQTLLERFGRLDRSAVVEPAIRLAEEGFTPGEHGAGLLERFADDLRDDDLGAAWLDDLGPDARLTNPELAATLRAFAAEGAAPFYRGDIARDLVDAVREAGGILKLEDLRAYEVDTREPLAAERFGHTWYSVPPESAGGYTLLAALALLERWSPAEGEPPWTERMRMHATAEALRGPFIDRARYFGDPRFVDVPVTALLADERVARRAAAFDPVRAVDPADYDLPLDGHEAAGGDVPPGRGTSHLCVVDAEGNVASITTSINWPFGIREAVRGFWVNNELDDFTKDTSPGGDAAPWEGEGPNVARPHRRPVSSMAPALVFDEAERPVLCLGGSGGTRIVSAVLQVGYRVVVLEQAPGRAVAAPRIHASDASGVAYEEAVPEALLEGLRARGHPLEPMRYGANVQAIAIDRPMSELGTDVRLLRAGSDPRKGGRPAGR